MSLKPEKLSNDPVSNKEEQKNKKEQKKNKKIQQKVEKINFSYFAISLYLLLNRLPYPRI